VIDVGIRKAAVQLDPGRGEELPPGRDGLTFDLDLDALDERRPDALVVDADAVRFAEVDELQIRKHLRTCLHVQRVRGVCGHGERQQTDDRRDDHRVRLPRVTSQADVDALGFGFGLDVGARGRWAHASGFIVEGRHHEGGRTHRRR
jgi:hypothetical protein